MLWFLSDFQISRYDFSRVLRTGGMGISLNRGSAYLPTRSESPSNPRTGASKTKCEKVFGALFMLWD